MSLPFSSLCCRRVRESSIEVPFQTTFTSSVTLHIVFAISSDFFRSHQPVQPCRKGMDIPYLACQLPMILLHLVIELVIPCQRVFLSRQSHTLSKYTIIALTRISVVLASAIYSSVFCCTEGNNFSAISLNFPAAALISSSLAPALAFPSTTVTISSAVELVNPLIAIRSFPSNSSFHPTYSPRQQTVERLSLTPSEKIGRQRRLLESGRRRGKSRFLFRDGRIRCRRHRFVL